MARRPPPTGSYHLHAPPKEGISRPLFARSLLNRAGNVNAGARRANGTPTERHRERPRGRGPPGTSAPTTHRAMSANARHVRTRTPCAHLVGRDVLGAPLPTERHRERPRVRGPPGTSAPTTHRAMSAHARHVRTRTPCAHLVGRDVPGAPLPTGRHRGRPRVRGPPGTSAPTTHHPISANARHVRTRTPCAHLVGRDVLGAPLPTGRHQGRPRARGPPGTSAPTTFHAEGGAGTARAYLVSGSRP